MENLDDFLKVNKQSSILEDFFLNFRHQFQQPTDFPFYRIPASLLDTLDVFTDMLRHPEDNKAFIDLYKINPNDYPILAQEQESPSETAQQSVIGSSTGQSAAGEQSVTGQQPVTEQQAQPLGFESRVDWEQLARLGVTRQSLEQSGDLSAVLSGGKSGLVTISTEIEGIPITTQGRIHFQEGADGKLDLKIDCYRREAALDLPFHGVLLDKETRDNILATGNAGHPVLLPLDGGVPKPLPRFTGQVDQQPRRRSGGRHPYPDGDQGRHPHPGAAPPALRRRQSIDRGHGLAVEKQVRRLHAVQRSQRKSSTTTSTGWTGTATRKWNSSKRHPPHSRKAMRRHRTMHRPPPNSLSPKGCSARNSPPEQQEKFGKMETIYVTGMKDRDGQPFNAYVRMNLDRGKPDFFRYNPDKAKKSGKGNHPHSRPQDTGSGEQRCNRRSHRHVQRPLKPAAAQPAQVEAAKQEGKKEVKKKERQRKKIIKT